MKKIIREKNPKSSSIQSMEFEHSYLNLCCTTHKSSPLQEGIV